MAKEGGIEKVDMGTDVPMSIIYNTKDDVFSVKNQLFPRSAWALSCMR